MKKKSVCMLISAACILTLVGCNNVASSPQSEKSSDESQDSSIIKNDSSVSVSNEESSLPESSRGEVSSSFSQSSAEHSSSESESSFAPEGSNSSSEPDSSIPEESGSSDEPTSSIPEESGSNSEPTISFSRTQSEVKADILATKFDGYSFKEESDLNGKVEGTVDLATNSYRLSATQTLLNQEKSLFKYVGFSDDEYFNIENSRSSTHAKKKDIAQEVNEERKETKITVADAASDVSSAKESKTLYGENWFTVDASSLFMGEENNTFKVTTIDSSSYKVTMSATIDGTSHSLELLFNASNELTYGKLVSVEVVSGGDEGWDDGELYATSSTTSVTTKEATFSLGEQSNAPLIDTSAYFIADITDFSVSSYMDVKENSGKALVGETIKAPRIDKFVPSTALNASDFEIVNSSNTDVIGYESFCYKALSAGTSILTISDARRSVTKTIEITVEVPPLSLISIHLPARSMKVGESLEGTVSYSPAESDEEVEAVSLNEDIAQVTMSDRDNLTITGVKAGKAIIEIHSKKNPATKTNVEITVEKAEADASWIVGGWNYTAKKYTVQFVFANDKTGTATQTFTDDGMTNKASFVWDVDKDGNLTFTSWESKSTGPKEDFQKPSKVTSNASTSSIVISFAYLDWTDNGEDYSYRSAYNISLTKKAEQGDELWPANNYYGTTNKDFTVTLNLNADHTATFICENKTYQIKWSTEAVKNNTNLIRFHFSFITKVTNGEEFIDSADTETGCYGTVNHVRGKYGMINIGYKSNSVGTTRFTLFIQK